MKINWNVVRILIIYYLIYAIILMILPDDADFWIRLLITTPFAYLTISYILDELNVKL